NAATGAQLWVTRYNGPGGRSDAATSVAASPGGGTVYVTGLSQGTTTNLDYATGAYNAATGARLWLTRYNGPANTYDAPSWVAVSPTRGPVYVPGPGGDASAPAASPPCPAASPPADAPGNAASPASGDRPGCHAPAAA